MTIPTRPAPAPPQMRNFNGSTSNAAADANASLEQLRLQLQQQQQQQKQQQKLTIKLPPPPKGSTNINDKFMSHAIKNNNNDFEVAGPTSTSITRKFPKARYAPTTNWNDTPFDPFESTAANGNVKKVPPPRPPPPKIIVNSGGGQKNPNSSSSASTNILSTIFHRKKTSSSSSSNAAKQHSAARVYGVSSGNYGSLQTADCKTTSSSSLSAAAAFTNSDWNAAWNSTTSMTTTTTTTTKTTMQQNVQDGQLISFDSPPSSPTFTQKSNSDCVSVDSFSSDSNFSSPQNGSVSQPESGFEDDFSATSRSRPATTSPLDPWEAFSAFNGATTTNAYQTENYYSTSTASIGTAPVRNFTRLNTAATTIHDNPLCNGRSLLPPAPSMSMPTIIKPKILQKPKAPRPPMFSVSKMDTDLATPPSPPMPQCAPPPPPSSSSSSSTSKISILDVISGKSDALYLTNGDSTTSSHDDSPPYGIALYDFDGAEEDDLSFRENEKIYLLERVSEDWYRGRTRAGCVGILPVNYIEIKVPLPDEIPATTTVTANHLTKSNANNLSSNSEMPKIRCLYHFPAEVDGDLELKENDMVTVLYRINEDWLFGKINNRQGQFPANFLEYIPDNIPLA